MCAGKDLGLFQTDLVSPKPLILRFHHYPFFSSNSLVNSSSEPKAQFWKGYTYVVSRRPLGGLNPFCLETRSI